MLWNACHNQFDSVANNVKAVMDVQYINTYFETQLS